MRRRLAEFPLPLVTLVFITPLSQVKLFKINKKKGAGEEDGRDRVTEVVDKFLSASMRMNLQNVGSKLRMRREAEAEKRRKLWEARGGSEEADTDSIA